MNLTILIGHFPPGAFGGAELQAEAWARRLAARHRVTVVTRCVPHGLPPSERRDGYEIVRLPVSRVPLLRTAVDLDRIARAVGAIEPRPDLMLCFQTFVSGLAGVRAQRRLGVPAAVWVRSEVEYDLRSPRMRMIGPAVWGAARGVLVHSEGHRAAMLDALARGAPGLRDAVAAKLEVIPNGVDLPPPAVGRRGDRVLTVGRLIPDKGTDVVVEAMAGNGGRLTVAGEGPERDRLVGLARARGVDARFEGYVGRERLEALFREASCLVLGARRGEGRPNVLLEAMARGLPVVATPIAGVSDLVADGVNGLLVPAGEPGALRAALARLEREPGLADRLGRAARESVEAFAWDLVEPRLEAVLDRWRRA